MFLLRTARPGDKAMNDDDDDVCMEYVYVWWVCI
jgi:hypothetical protein